MRAIGKAGRGASNRARRIRALLAGTALSALTTLPAAAQNATWLNPAPIPGPVLGTRDFDDAANWTVGTPVALTNGPTGTATFGVSTTTDLSFSTDTTVGAWTFGAGASNYTFTNGQTLAFSGAGISVLGGSATITNNFNLNFNNSSTAGNATITNNHNTIFFNNSSAGNATILNSGFVGFTALSLGGTARLVNNTPAALIDISGITGTFLNTGSIEGSGNVLLGSKRLGVGLNNLSTDFSGVISGTGTSELTKFGTGTLTLSGVNTYTGITGVTEGTLVVAAGGSIASSQTVVQPDARLIVDGIASRVNMSGTLSGTGTVGLTRINDGATFAPGSGVAGTHMTVTGSLAFDSGAIYLVQINPAGASSANVGNFGTLAGTVNAQFASGSYVARTYTILSATNGLQGTTFNSLTTNNLPGGFTAHLSYLNDHAVILNLEAVLGLAPSVRLKRNQQSAATAINKFFNNGGVLPPSFVTVFGLTGAAAANALTQLSGETAAGSQQTTFNAMTQFLGTLLDPFIGGRSETPTARATPFAAEDDANAYASASGKRSGAEREAYAAIYRKASIRDNYDPRWSVWAAGFGGSQTTSGNATLGTNNTTSRLGGTAAGADYRFSPYSVAGLRSPAAARTSTSPTAWVAAAQICSRSALSCGTRPGRPTYQLRWPMAGSTSPPTAS